MITTLIWLYLAFMAVIFLHEVGHAGKKIHVRWFPPSGWSEEGRLPWGGLAMNLLIAYAVFRMRPENTFLIYIGVIAWAHFILYAILGSFNKEISMKKQALWNLWSNKSYSSFVRRTVFDDVPNEYWWIYVPAGILAFWFMKGFYIPIIVSIWTSVIA